MARLLRKLISTVAESAAEKGMLASERIAGLTTTIYIEARKVAIPARISVRTLETRRLAPKYWSSQLLCLMAGPASVFSGLTAREVELGSISDVHCYWLMSYRLAVTFLTEWSYTLDL